MHSAETYDVGMQQNLSPSARPLFRRAHGRVATVIGLVLLAVLAAPPRADAQAGVVSLQVDGAQRFQRVDGFGVNINSNQWNGGQLAPVLDTLIDTVGVTTWRVIVESHENWEPAAGGPGAPAINGDFYRALYEAPKFQSLWGVLGYLAQRGQQQVLLNVMGAAPETLGRTVIRADAEDRWVEMIASLVAYGRQVKGLPIGALSPMNEVDLGFPEGPRVEPTQYARLLQKLSDRLDGLGLQDVALVPPDIASPGNIAAYLTPLLAAPRLMAKVAHFGLHDYSGNAGNIGAIIAASAYADRTFWLTEFSAGCGGCDGGAQAADQWDFAADTIDQLLAYVDQGAASALIYDGYDSVYEHHQSIGHWGLLSYDPATGAYAPRKRLYAAAQALRFTLPGMVRIGVAADSGYVAATAFVDPASGALTIVGHNRATNPMTLAVALGGMSAPATLALYQTTPGKSLSRGADVSSGAGSFTLTVDAQSVFTLTTLSGPAANATPFTPSAGGPAIAATVAPAPASPAQSVVLGVTDVQPNPDTNSAGTAEAFAFTASASGLADTLAIYLDATNQARSVILGLYDAAGAGAPASLLGQTTITAPRPGEWNSGTIPVATITAGRQYWIAVLAPADAGAVVFRDQAANGGPNQTSAETTLTQLPATWTAGNAYQNAPLSAYAALAATPAAGGVAGTVAVSGAAASAPPSPPQSTHFRGSRRRLWLFVLGGATLAATIVLFGSWRSQHGRLRPRR